MAFVRVVTVCAATCSIVMAGSLDPLFERCDGVIAFGGRRWAAACAGGVGLWDAEGRSAGPRMVLATGVIDLLEEGGAILAAAGPRGLARLRPGSPGRLEVMALYPRPGAVYQVAAASGGSLLLAEGSEGLAEVVIDVGGTLHERSRFDAGALVRGVTVAGDQVLASLGAAGLLLLRRGEQGLAEVARLPTVDAREAVLVEGSEGRQAVVADGRGGVVVVAVEPDGLREVTRQPPLDGAAVRGLDLLGRRVLTAEGRAGGRLLGLDARGRLTVLRRFHLPEGSYLDAAFSKDGRRAAWASDRSGVVCVGLSVKTLSPGD
ncbi:MAG: hypothetical protein Q9Q40_13425 [Acidobacteriota bacterium]|nr:hypothetical protein [Acidobacteriota bacterium]MDQ7086588.1 hypothetical protein [Acidobacteriota bacterium]